MTLYIDDMCAFDAESLYHSVLGKIRAAYNNEVNQHNLAFVGIWSGGAWLAERLANDLGVPKFGVLSISLHRDDYAEKGLPDKPCTTSLPFDVNERQIVLVDDVLYTGRTIRAALNELYDFGRPATVELAVLADRGGRELPIAARFVGATVDVPADQTLVLKHDDQGKWVFYLEPARLEPIHRNAI